MTEQELNNRITEILKVSEKRCAAVSDLGWTSDWQAIPAHTKGQTR